MLTITYAPVNNWRGRPILPASVSHLPMQMRFQNEAVQSAKIFSGKTLAEGPVTVTREDGSVVATFQRGKLVK
jgi:hypothetical protein